MQVLRQKAYGVSFTSRRFVRQFGWVTIRTFSSDSTNKTDEEECKAHEYTFNTSKPGLGAAPIHTHYDYLGGAIQVPPFLKQPKTVAVIGAPMSWGQPLAGTDQGAKMLRAAGLEEILTSLKWKIGESRDLKFEPPRDNDPMIDRKLFRGEAKNCYCVGKALQEIYNAVNEALSKGHFPLLLGGDHSVAAGTLAAVLSHRPDTGVIWVDAHGDLNTPATSPSGNMHGMPVALLMALCDTKRLPGFDWMENVPLLRPEQIVMVGLRDLDPAEREFIRNHGIRAFTMQHIDKFGIGRTMEMAIDYLRYPDGRLRPLHMSYDIDAVDPEEAPSTGTVVRGGLNFREAHYVAEAVSETGMLGSMDLVEVNPMLCPGKEAEMTKNLGLALIASSMGSRIL